MVLGCRRMPVSVEIVADSADMDSDIEQQDAGKFIVEDGKSTAKLEPWVGWIQRATHDVEAKCKDLGMESWIEKARGMKWNLAERIVNQDPQFHDKARLSCFILLGTHTHDAAVCSNLELI